ncbi:hypothetical protein ACFOEK_09630 [Litoribrevibacter euphylliae]|uniref:DUF3301 domain-containing protein n=1 Tax=Litoribrevibacter euphylliae TaxID=1834034 RepID=A0ABV7HEZ9_9GAMM
MYKAGCIILSVAVITVSVLYWRESNHNDYHRSKMHQFQFMDKLGEFIGRDITEFQSVYPSAQCENDICVVDARKISYIDVFKDESVSAIDFFGIELVLDKGKIVNIRQHKP